MAPHPGAPRTARPGLRVGRGGPTLDRALGAPLGMFLGFVAAFVNATDRARAHLLFKSIAVSAAAYAAYGMFAHILIRHL